MLCVCVMYRVESLFSALRFSLCCCQVVYGFTDYCIMASLKAKYEGNELDTVVSTYEQAMTKGSLIHRLAAKVCFFDFSFFLSLLVCFS